MVYDFEDAWNRHDMTAFAALFHDDADWVHWRGGTVVRRQAIHDGHKSVHDTYYVDQPCDRAGHQALISCRLPWPICGCGPT